jgi:hypothetical protein
MSDKAGVAQAEVRKIIVPGNEWRPKVIDELHELTGKIVRLRRFMNTEDFYKLSEQQCNLLRDQSRTMCQYADILTKRLQSN